MVSTPPSTATAAPLRRTLLFALVLGYVFELIRTGWVGDDAVITLRTVMNFVHGYGPVFNVDERVQAYTHPLWFFLISGLTLVVKNPFYAALILSAVFSVGTLVLLFSRVASSLTLGTLAALTLMLSKAFVDYSTSGLENPLSHFLTISFVLCAVAFRQTPTGTKAAVLFGFCSLFYLCRPDLVLLCVPTALVLTLRAGLGGRCWLLAATVGALPFVLWTVFSVYYYGFPFPNTAYAKLGLGIPRGEVMGQGLLYLFDSLGRDPLTLATVVAGVAVGFRAGRLEKSLAAGILLYIFYTIYVGGDFMSGRFLTTPFVASLALVALSDLGGARLRVFACAAGAFGILSLQSTWLSSNDFTGGKRQIAYVADERGNYYASGRGVLTGARLGYRTPHWQADLPKKGERTVEVRGRLGYNSLHLGPGVHVVDPIGLSDPLLARLAPKHVKEWRPGHAGRQIPTNYLQSIRTGQNLLVDGATRELYRDLLLITRGELHDSRRWGAILRLNLGRGAKVDDPMYRYEEIPLESTD